MSRRFTAGSLSFGCALLALHLAPIAVAADAVVSCDTTPPLPSPPGNAKTFAGRAGADNTEAIQKAVNQLRAGDWLVFPRGTYNISKHVTLSADGITLYGKGAVIHSTSATDGGLMIQADNVAVYGFTLDQDSKSRQGTPWSGGISVFDQRSGQRRRITGTRIRGNTINNAANAGIFLYRASLFTVADNVIYRSWADGIHLTGGSSYGRVIHNRVSQNGDDMIAIVSYAGERGSLPAALKYQKMSLDNLDRNLYVAGNTLTDTYWGRGISVVGGQQVTIEDNDISKTPTAAGIYVLRERSYATFGAQDIVIRGNTISQTQTAAPTYKPTSVVLTPTHHGAIEVSSQMTAEEFADSRYREALKVSRVAIVGNTIRGARFAGVRVGAASDADKTVTNVVVKGNQIEDVGLEAVVEVHPGIDRSSLSCSQNELDNKSWPSACDESAGASAKASGAITGATLVCLADGSIRKPPAPRAPFSFEIEK